jgi:type II secretory pathway pseudopilin PulG
MTNNSRSGFTLMEMIVIIFILVLISAAVIPNVVAYQRSEQEKSLVASIARLPAQARDDAVRLQVPVRLRIDGSTIVEEEVPLTGPVQQLNEVDLGSDIQVDQTQKNYQNIDSSSWDWTAYPDGTADLGGVQFSVESEQRSLIIPVVGNATWTTGALPDESQDQWTAGQLLQRAS